MCLASHIDIYIYVVAVFYMYADFLAEAESHDNGARPCFDSMYDASMACTVSG